jgi:hypothetical protein
MSTSNGIYSIADLKLVKNASAAEFGMDKIAQTIAAETNYLNQTVNEMLSNLCTPTTAQIVPWGGNQATAMSEVDEFGYPLPQKQSVGINASVALKLFRQNLGWTSKFFEIATPAEIAEQYSALKKGYFNQVIKQIKKAIFTNTSASVVDRLYNGVTLTVYPFINADSTVLPDSPAGATFDGATHDHYDGESSLTATYVDNLVADVTEHGNTKGVEVWCALSNATAVAALTGFTALPDSATQTLLSQLVSGQTKNNGDLENRQIGYWKDGVPVFVKPYVPASYMVCAALGMPEKPLLYRQRPQAALQGWRIASQFKDFPLIADYAEAEFGFAAYNRTMLAVLYTGNATYAIPTIS